MNGYFTLPYPETVAQTFARLAEGTTLGWPGSVSIHGKMNGIKASKRRHERDEPQKRREERKQRTLPSKIEQRFFDEARLYAAADKSDPFVFDRAVTHIKNGIAVNSQDGKPVHYTARQATETRRLAGTATFSDGSTEWQAAVYKDIARP